MSMGPADPFGPCCWSVGRGQCRCYTRDGPGSPVLFGTTSPAFLPIKILCGHILSSVQPAAHTQQELCSFTEPIEHVPYHYEEIITHIPPFQFLLDG